MTTYKLVMPEDLNHYGFLFGGKLLMWIDEIAWIAVSNDHPACRFVTVGMNEVTFKKSVYSNSVLRFETSLKSTGNTSITYHIEVYSRRIDSCLEENVFHTDITFVRLDGKGRKISVN